jgi:hypothetical protein
MAYCCELIASTLKKPIPDDFLEQYRIRMTAALHAELEPDHFGDHRVAPKFRK